MDKETRDYGDMSLQERHDALWKQLEETRTSLTAYRAATNRQRAALDRIDTLAARELHSQVCPCRQCSAFRAIVMLARQEDCNK
jgi:hypothetical protein